MTMITTNPTCKARVTDSALPSNTSQVRQCRHTTINGEKFCPTHR